MSCNRELGSKYGAKSASVMITNLDMRVVGRGEANNIVGSIALSA